MANSKNTTAETVTLHLQDIMELSYLADTVIDVLIYQNLRFGDDGKPSSIEPFTHEQDVLYLQNLQKARENPFFVFGGKWQGRPYRDFVYEMDEQEMCDQYLLPHKEHIVNLMHSVAEKDKQEELGEDITDDFLLDLFTVKWYKLLEKFADVAKWRSEHGLPTKMPGGYDDGGWYVWVDGRLETGPLEYVAAEYCLSGLCYCFDCQRANPDFPDYHDHEHSFEGVLKAALENPEAFTLKGFKKDYSKQERKFLKKFVKKLRQDKAENMPKRIEKK